MLRVISCVYSLPRLCLEGSYSLGLKGAGSVVHAARYPQLRLLGATGGTARGDPLPRDPHS